MCERKELTPQDKTGIEIGPKFYKTLVVQGTLYVGKLLAITATDTSLVQTTGI